MICEYMTDETSENVKIHNCIGLVQLECYQVCVKKARQLPQSICWTLQNGRTIYVFLFEDWVVSIDWSADLIYSKSKMNTYETFLTENLSALTSYYNFINTFSRCAG